MSRHSKVLLLLLTPAVSAAGAQTPADSLTQESVFCQAASIKPRNEGLIVSPIFTPRSAASLPWLRQAFAGFLRASYAPYGNTWLFRDESTLCSSYPDRMQAQEARDAAILADQRAGRQAFYVTFIGP